MPAAERFAGFFISTVDQPDRESKNMDDQPKNTGKFGPGNPGKPKGALNKVTKAAKEAIAEAAERLGGVDRLVEWVKEDPSNERVFWGTVYPKLLPLQVTGEGGGPLETVARIELVAMKSNGDSKD